MRKLYTKALAKGVEETENGVVVTYEVKGEEKKVEADYVFVTGWTSSKYG